MTNTFQFLDKDYTYCDVKYNNSRLNERAIEVPLGLSLLEQYRGNCLEIGAVLPYYSDIEHTVIDLLDGHEMTTNANILTWFSKRKFKAAIAISTLEHVGDGYVDTLIAIECILAYLEPNAPYLFTIPHGFNAELDSAIREKLAKVDNYYQFNKVDFKKHYWKQVGFGSLPLAYNGQSQWSNTVYVLTGIKHE